MGNPPLAPSAAPPAPSASAVPPEPSAPPPPPPVVPSRISGLEAADFTLPLDPPFIRATNPTLTNTAFATKWQASLASPVLFMRAYPGAYHADLARVDPRRILGPEGLCFGDAHPDNFGFLALTGSTRFVFNDLDDSGYCPIAVDAARYLAVLRISYPALAVDALSQYVDTAFDAAVAVRVAPSLTPDMVTVAEQALDKATTSSGRIKLDAETVAPTPAERLELAALVAGDPRLATFGVLDTAVRLRQEGGSGGLRRYWIVVDRPLRSRTLLELKESVTPGVDFGRPTRTLAPETRLELLTRAFWGVTPNDDYFYVPAFGARFLLRDRLARASVDLAALDTPSRREVVRAQVSAMALVHGPQWRSTCEKDELRAWLDRSAATLAERWRTVYDAANR